MGAPLLAEAPLNDLPGWVYLVVALVLLLALAAYLALIYAAGTAGMLLGRYLRTMSGGPGAFTWWLPCVSSVAGLALAWALERPWVAPLASLVVGIGLGTLTPPRGAVDDAPTGPPDPLDPPDADRGRRP